MNQNMIELIKLFGSELTIYIMLSNTIKIKSSVINFMLCITNHLEIVWSF